MTKDKSSAPAGALPAAGAGSAARDLSAADYDAFIATPGRLVVVDFHADWCGPCKRLGPVLEQVAGEFPETVSLGKINVDYAKDLAVRAGVRGIPDVRMFRDGKQVDRFVGVIDADEVRRRFHKHSDDLQVTNLDEPASAPAPASVPLPESTQVPASATNFAPPPPPVIKSAPASEPAPAPNPSIQPMKKDWLPPGMQRR